METWYLLIVYWNGNKPIEQVKEDIWEISKRKTIKREVIYTEQQQVVKL